jgi:microcystin-dependent protein
LRVSNGAGTADQPFQLIQGPAGPPGADGSPDTAAQVLAKLVSVDGSGSGLDADSLDGMQAADIQASLDALSAQMSTLVPPGTIAPFAGSTVPEGWLLCDGSEIDRTQYPELFAAIGVTHGGGDLINTFHLPDLRGRFLRGVDGGTGRDPDAASRAQAQTGGNSGDAVGSIQGDSYASHTHPNTWARVHDCSSGASGTNSSYWSNSCSRAQATSTQASGGNENRPKNVSVSFIIKY